MCTQVRVYRNLFLLLQSLTVQDAKKTTIEDVGTQFFLTEDDAAQSRNR